mmetsp:Transcript_114482/g.334705  ORF Transcript_114482/g.334705 Transcript_114482/m.334705 type:complete len:143 (-) Transcript_114482:40-468(-)
MAPIPALWASRLHRLSLLVGGLALLNLSLVWSLFSFWTWGTELLPSPDKIAGLLIFGVSCLCTFLVACVAAVFGFPSARRGSVIYVYVFKLLGAVALFMGMQLWIAGRLLWWQYHRWEVLHAPDAPQRGLNASAGGRRPDEL